MKSPLVGILSHKPLHNNNLIVVGGILPPHLDFSEPFREKKKPSPIIQHPIGNHKRNPRLFQ